MLLFRAMADTPRAMKRNPDKEARAMLNAVSDRRDFLPLARLFVQILYLGSGQDVHHGGVIANALELL